MRQLSEFACGGEAAIVPINESITAVASAAAEAVASVIGSCSGEGDATATLQGLARAEQEAVAIGQAAAGIVATAEYCQLCTIALESMVAIAQNVTATAVAEASLSVRPQT